MLLYVVISSSSNSSNSSRSSSVIVIIIIIIMIMLLSLCVLFVLRLPWRLARHRAVLFVAFYVFSSRDLQKWLILLVSQVKLSLHESVFDSVYPCAYTERSRDSMYVIQLKLLSDFPLRSICICICTCMCICICMCIYIYIYIYTLIYVYTYTYIYIYTERERDR